MEANLIRMRREGHTKSQESGPSLAYVFYVMLASLSVYISLWVLLTLGRYLGPDLSKLLTMTKSQTSVGVTTRVVLHPEISIVIHLLLSESCVPIFSFASL